MPQEPRRSVKRSPYVVLLVAMLALPLRAAEPPRVPDLIKDARFSGALWVSADALLDEQRRLRGELLAERADDIRRRMQLNSSRPPADQTVAEARALPAPGWGNCRLFSGSLSEHFEPTGSLSDLALHAKAVVSGRVRAIKQGLLGGDPGMLIALDATTIKGDSTPETYLFYPLARIDTADGSICAKPLGRYAMPRVGDRFLIFEMTGPLIVGDRMILMPDTRRELVHERGAAALLLPDALHAQTGDTLDEIQQDVVALVTRGH